MTLSDAVAHLSPERWEQANRLLIRKALAEFAHERLITPEADGPSYVVRSDDGLTRYRFTAVRRALDHWQVDAESIARTRDGAELPLAALDFFIELRESLGLSDEILPVYLEEISATLSGTCYKLTKDRVPVAELVRAGFQDIETGMTEGHPCFVANNGRLGFGVHDYLSYAPETASTVRLVWLAAHRSRAAFTAGAGIEYESFVREELGGATVERFYGVLRERGLDPADYLLVPVHPWQWWNKLTVTFAAEVARGYLVCLGEGDDEYLAQQSVRTFFNRSHPRKHYVKTALSVLNMGFMRGLSAAYMEATPAINDWLAQLIENDPVLKATGLSIIQDRADLLFHLSGTTPAPRRRPAGSSLSSPAARPPP
ncbi:IucA/IucC family protein, partial [Streptomyces sp. NPDC007162]|uniref:IucA/IucC family protein n=1 Tax=Streptomyces sp. NPDC007162 TaxID=3156917 RepID=UPI0033E9430B